MSELKAAEMRVWNWIFFDRDYCQVVEIYSYGGVRLQYKNKGRTLSAVDLSEISPIPLSEDILLKAGFVKKDWRDGSAYSVFIGPAKSRFLILTKMTKNSLLVLMSETNNETVLSELWYVHQLQNLYHSLKGIELNIEL